MTAESTFIEKRREHWDRVAVAGDRRWSTTRGYHRRLEQVYRHLIPAGQRVLEVGSGRGDLLAAVEPSVGVGVDLSREMVVRAQQKYPKLRFVEADALTLELNEKFDAIILSDLVNDLWDVQGTLERVRRFTTPHTRIVLNYFSRVWEFPLRAMRGLHVARPTLQQNWLTVEDIDGLLRLANYEPIHHWGEVIWPVRTPLIDDLANRYAAKMPLLRLMTLTNFMIARPLSLSPLGRGWLAEGETGEGKATKSHDSSEAQTAGQSGASPSPQPSPLGERGYVPRVTVVVPARNEAGNVPDIVRRVPNLGGGTELIFVEGHSSDDTYAAIEKVIAENPGRGIKLFRQTGKGKGDAVRLGFKEATGDILMILDADLTVAPEDLPRFYDAIATGKAEFVNGVRLVYPMEVEAMRFLNLLGNKFFGLAFSWLLGQSIKDTLCGTKVLSKENYERIANNRAYFGDFDPFGDFDLLFGAAKLNLKIVDLPIRYRQRTYGSTNIQRWKHGVLLLRMTAFAARRIKFV